MSWWFAWLQVSFEREFFSAEDLVPVGATCICAFYSAATIRQPGGGRYYWSFTRGRRQRICIWDVWDGFEDILQYDFVLFHNIIAFGFRNVLPEILTIDNNWVALAAFRAYQRLYPGEYDDSDDDIWGGDF